MKFILNLFLVFSLLFSTQLNAGWLKDAAKVAVVAGAVKAYKVTKEKKNLKKTKKSMNGTFEKVTTKNKHAPNGERTVYQREINPDLVIERETKKLGKIPETNLERMKQGLSPKIEKNGKLETVELHHSRQNNNGSIFELSKSTHSIKNELKGQKAVHPYTPDKHPENPVSVDRTIFNNEKSTHWKQRAEDVEKAKGGVGDVR